MQNYMKYIIGLAILILSSVLYERFRDGVQEDEDARNYRLVKKYLLNDSSLARSKLPILWIHIDYEKNARWWPSFGSRLTEDLNQPYLYLCMKSMIDKCGGDFNICLIDDDTFGKILPGWTVDFSRISEPVKNKMRNLALARVLHHYGGLTVPAGFICMKNLAPMYHVITGQGKMVVGEIVDRNITSTCSTFFPTQKFLGCKRDCPSMAKYAESLEKIASRDFTDESVFAGTADRELLAALFRDEASVVDARLLGAEDESGAPIGIEDLLGDSKVGFDRNLLGVYIPSEEILNRVAYQWFARLSAAQALDSNTTVGDLLRSARIAELRNESLHRDVHSSEG